MQLAYVICDVFTDRPLAGNQLAVFTDGAGVETATMQALAREMNFSETTFVCQVEAADADARVRIFTPMRELRFAGHPTLGTAAVLAQSRDRRHIRLETGAGVVPVRLEARGPNLYFGWMTQPIPRVTRYPAADALFEALGVKGSRAPVEVYDNGIRHVYVELESPEAVAALRPNLEQLSLLTETVGANTFAGAGTHWKTRMFAPGHGVNEDPATGSAAGPLALHLARHGRIAYGTEITIEQGAEVGRPSLLHARADGNADRVERVEVGGHVVPVARGEFSLP